MKVTLDPDLGDAWGNYYAFEVQHGTPEQQEEVPPPTPSLLTPNLTLALGDAPVRERPLAHPR